MFKLDHSNFTQKGHIRADFRDNKDNKTKNKVNDNGEGSSKAATTTINNNNNGVGDDNSDDELAVGQENDDHSDHDSGSEADDSNDSDFILTSKRKMHMGKRRNAVTAATTTASSSHSSTSKRKRTPDDTGDEEKEETAAYYVLRCALREDCKCAAYCPFTHDSPASRKGVFSRHPFKKMRAMEHFKRCEIAHGDYSNEKKIWLNACEKGEYFPICSYVSLSSI